MIGRYRKAIAATTGALGGIAVALPTDAPPWVAAVLVGVGSILATIAGPANDTKGN